MQGGYHATISKKYNISYLDIYKQKNSTFSTEKPIGKVYQHEVFLVTDTQNSKKLIVTRRGEVGWVSEEWIQQV
jgi:hypothetical protein